MRIFILAACWGQPAVQIEALKTISAGHPNTIFVTFRIPKLVLASSLSEIIDQCVRAAVNTVRYPGAPRYMFNKQSVIFERGVGPLQVAYGVKTTCCCEREYASSTNSSWWNKGETSLVYRKRCRGATPLCLDVLEVQEGRAAAAQQHG
jgi:hypothetical protein